MFEVPTSCSGSMKNVLIVFFVGLFSVAGHSTELEWDQQLAKARVQQVLDIEKQGVPWEDINWMIDTGAAVIKAQEMNKPLFVFIFMKTEVGPPEAPC